MTTATWPSMLAAWSGVAPLCAGEKDGEKRRSNLIEGLRKSDRGMEVGMEIKNRGVREKMS